MDSPREAIESVRLMPILPYLDRRAVSCHDLKAPDPLAEMRNAVSYVMAFRRGHKGAPSSALPFRAERLPNRQRAIHWCSSGRKTVA